VHEGGTLLPTLLCSLQCYHPNIAMAWYGRICMFSVLLRFAFISFVYKVYIYLKMLRV
jgi:hypothetical protein